MPATIGMFGFRLEEPHETERPQVHPRVIFELITVLSQHGKERPLLSADLMTEREIDKRIAEMKEDLDAMANQAKRALKKAVAKT